MARESKVNDKIIDYQSLSILLPSYDGNKKTLEFYIRGVENTLDLIENSQDEAIACLIRNKLTGKAAEALSQQTDFKVWDDIRRILRSRFGECKDETQLIEELMLLSAEKCGVDQFSEKVRDITYALVNKDIARKAFYEKMAFNVFLDRLDPLIALNIRVKGIHDLSEAITVAKQEEAKLRNRKAITSNTKHVLPIGQQKLGQVSQPRLPQYQQSRPFQRSTFVPRPQFTQPRPQFTQPRPQFSQPQPNSSKSVHRVNLQNKIETEDYDPETQEQCPSEEEYIDENFCPQPELEEET